MSTVVFVLILFLITIILRRKGYGVRLGLACIILYARPGSRRFPDGVQVRLTTRIVGFLFGGCRGPWLDIYADRFYMRLRPATSAQPSIRGPWFRLLHYYYLGIAAVNRGYWSTLSRNLLSRVLAFWIRGLRVRVEKVRVWKEGGSLEYKAEQFVFSGRAFGLFGSQYSLSVNELYVNFCKPSVDNSPLYQPIRAALVLQRGVEIVAYLTPRFLTILRPHRLAILDDLRISFSVSHISCHAPRILHATVAHIAAELSPGYSDELLVKLPAVPPPARRPRKPGILRFWEANGALHGLSVRFTVPVSPASFSRELPSVSTNSLSLSSRDPSSSRDLLSAAPTSEFGAFIRLDSVRVDAYGKTAEERYEAMTHASVSLRGCSAGSITVDALSHSLYEAAPADVGECETTAVEHAPGRVESVENIDKIVAARPEALVWIEDLSAALDVNCSKHHATRVDLAGSGGVLAIEPVGLVILVKEIRSFMSHYASPPVQLMRSFPSEESDSHSSSSKSGSTGSLPVLTDDPNSVRVVSELCHWTVAVLGRGPVGDGDTLAIVASTESISLPQVDFFCSSLLRVCGAVKSFELMHWSRWDRTTNVSCEEAKFDIQRGPHDEKKIALKNATIEWDLDVQSGLEALPTMFAALNEIRSSTAVGPSGENGPYDAGWVPPPPPPRMDYDRVHLSELERRELRDRKFSKLLDKLRAWQLSGSNISVTSSFPDGPMFGISIGTLPTFRLNSEYFVGRHVVLSLQDRKFAYGNEFKMGSPFHTMSKHLDKRSIDIYVRELIAILEHELQFGSLLQDWLLRFRAALRIMRENRWLKRGLSPPLPKKMPMVDIHFKSYDVAIYFEDHPIGSFLGSMLPLMQDEARERVLRDEVMAHRREQLRKVDRAQIAGTPFRCLEALQKEDSKIWVERVKYLRRGSRSVKVAGGYLPDLHRPPAATFLAASFSFDVVLDDLARQLGSVESIRRLRILDDYELGSKKHKKARQYDRDAWNSIGFRTVNFEATKVIVDLHDYPMPFLDIDHMYFDNTTMGQAVQATKEPYICETKIAIGKRRLVKLVKGLGPTKTYADIHLKVNSLHCNFNPSFLPAIADFGRGVSRFFSSGKNPSPRIPWFDSLRVSMHGRMRLTAKKFTGCLTSSVSPYSMTNHYTEIESDNFEMLTSRLEPSEEDPFPISWTFNNWHIRPSNFDEARRSEIVFDFLRVGMEPIISVGCGDPQDHYFVPFPSKEEVAEGGPGIGRGSATLIYTDAPVERSDTGFGDFTTWWTGLHEIPDYDSFKNFKTQSMILGIDVKIRHPKPMRPLARQDKDGMAAASVQGGGNPVSASSVYSDAVSTLTKVIKTLISRPISCRLPPRWLSLQRKPPSVTGFTTSLRGLEISVDAKDLNVMLHNNLEPGHSLFISIDSLHGELWKRTDVSNGPDGDVVRNSRLTRRRFEIAGIYSSIRVPDLNMAVDADNMGKLLTVDKISLSDNLQDEMKYIASPRKGGGLSSSSGFGSDDLDHSPFYTFSATHPLQRGKSLDKVQYDKRLLVDRVRLIWTPARRSSVFAWSDAFKVKTFCMKAPRTVFMDQNPDEDKDEDDVAIVGDSSRTEAGANESVVDDLIFGDLRNESHDTSALPMLKLSPGKLSAEHSGDAFKIDGAEGVSDNGDDTSSQTGVDLTTIPPRQAQGPLSPVMPLTRSKLMVKKKHGSMVDLLAPYDSSQSSSSENQEIRSTISRSQKKATGALEVLKTSPKFALYINDCEVVFGSQETIGHVFLTSKAVRVGIVDKRVQKAMQLGKDNEIWVDREFRFHLDAAELFTRDKSKGRFDFNASNWVPRGVPEDSDMSLVTQKPICMDLMYISSSSLPSEDGGEEDDHTLRPSLLFINIPDIRLSTNSCEFHAIIDVVRKVLMQSMRSSEIVKEELSNLRYKLQLAGGKVTFDELEDLMRRLNNATRQFLYAGDTFQPHLVESLMLPNEPTFPGTLLRYKAKAKAVATFMRQDQRATTTDVLYPTMYISYSFDKCSWEMREMHKELNKDIEDAFVEIALDDLVCRHIFYVGRGSSTEMTFANISAQNKMRSSYFQRILQPASSSSNYGSGESKRKLCGIKASDGASVSFRWYSIQEDRVGGIPVYELLTIQVAPMTAAVTRKLYSSVTSFLFSNRNKTDEEDSSEGQDGKRQMAFSRTGSRMQDSSATVSVGRSSSFESTASGKKGGAGASSTSMSVAVVNRKVDDVTQMARRGESSMLFKYIFIDAFELTASYKYKETNARGALDFFDLFVRTPSFSYSSQIWTWKAFSAQIRRDLVRTFFLRGASNLAKIKFLPGYSRARKHIARGADSVRESIYSRLPVTSSSNTGGDAAKNTDEGDQEERVDDGLKEADSDDNVIDAYDEADAQATIDAAVADISGAEDTKRREKVLKVLYGSTVLDTSRTRSGLSARVHKDVGKGKGRDGEKGGGKSRGFNDTASHESVGFRARARAFASGRSYTASSSQSHASLDGGGKSGLLNRLRRKVHEDR